jgi:hypothetical protein
MVGNSNVSSVVWEFKLQMARFSTELKICWMMGFSDLMMKKRPRRAKANRAATARYRSGKREGPHYELKSKAWRAVLSLSASSPLTIPTLK